MIAAYFIIGVVLFLLGCFLFDDLIKYQYESHHDEWIADGRPRGYGFHPNRSSYLSMCIIGWRHRKKIPGWANDDDAARIKYGRLIKFNRLWLWYCLLVFPVVIIATNT